MHRSAAALLGLLVLSATALAAQQRDIKVKEEKPGLLAQALIAPDSAIRIAQARLPAGRIRAAEIEVEGGRLLYSFDMRLPGKPGTEEVTVDARTGAVLGVEHEDAAAEARERKADSAAARP